MITVSRHRHRIARRLSWLAVVALVSAAWFAPGVAVPMLAGELTEITICHGTGSNDKPYVQESPAINSTSAFAGELADGHIAHVGPLWFDGIDEAWGDIIPPYDYEPADFHYGGLNWSPEGQAIYDNDCALPEPTPESTPEPTPESTPEPTPEPTPESTPEPTPEPTPESTPEPTPEPASALRIDKTNDARLEGNEAPDGTIDPPMAFVGDTLTYTLAYDLVDESVTNGGIADVLPIGVTYVDGSAVSNAEFLFQDYDDASRTLTWKADSVTEDGSVTYQATIDEGAAEFAQALFNVATIDSAETEPYHDDSQVLALATPPAVDTSVDPPFGHRIPVAPVKTLPPSDTLPAATSAPAVDRWRLILLAMAGLLAAALLVASPPAKRKDDRRR